MRCFRRHLWAMCEKLLRQNFMKKKIEHTITKEEVKKFAALSGDFNPIHTHDGVVHGMFLGALVSRLIGMELPGPGALMIKESLEFKKPARVGDTVTIT